VSAPTPQDAADEIKAAVSFGFLATDFVVQPETWPVFMAFARANGISPAFTREMAIELMSELAFGLNLISEMTFEARQ
jgi:hypothetical protein